jgi:CBS domain-containing protein
VPSFLSANIAALTVSDFVEPAATILPSEAVSRLIGNLKKSKAYEVFVEENDRTSIITFRELLDVEDAVTTKVSKVMLPVPRLNSGDSVLYAAKLMFENKLRALPVFKEGKLVGKITSPAIVRKMQQVNMVSGPVKKIMTPDPICLQNSDSVAKARNLMLRRRIDQLPILRDGKLNGAITSDAVVFSYLSQSPDRDAKGGSEEGRFDNPAYSLASVESTVNDAKDPISKIAGNMLERSTNYSVILEDGVVSGIVTFRDFLKLLPLKESDDGVPVSIVGLPANPLEAELVTEKFRASVKLLRTMDPTLSEARAIIKNKAVNSNTALHQVQVFIDALDWHENYETSGYDLSKLFGEIDSWVKRIAERHDRKPDRERKRDKTIRRNDLSE